MKAKIIMIAALATMMVACTSDETLTQQTAPKGEGMPFSAIITMGSQTRAITENTTEKTLETAFADGEEVALIHNGIVEVMSVTKNTDGSATISGTITGNPADNDDVTVVYPASAVDATTKAVKADLLKEQDGTLATIAKDLDLCQSSDAKLSVAAGHVSLNGTVTLYNQLAIVKFSLQDAKGEAISATSLVITDGNDGMTTVTPSAATSDFYVAMRPSIDLYYYFTAIVGTDSYTYTKTGVTLAKGTYYQSPLKMTFTKRDADIAFANEAVSQTWSATATENTYAQTASNTGTGTVTYSVNNDNTCGATIDPATGVVTFTQAGSVTVTATAADDDTYTYAASASYTLTVNKAAGSISYTTTSVEKKYGDTAFTNELTIEGDGTVSYESSDTKVAEVDPSTGEVTIKGTGSVTITATVADGTNYTYATKTAQYTLTVNSVTGRENYTINDEQNW